MSLTCAVSGCVDYLLTSLTCAVSGCVDYLLTSLTCAVSGCVDYLLTSLTCAVSGCVDYLLTSLTCAVSGCVDYLLTSLTCAVSGCVDYLLMSLTCAVSGCVDYLLTSLTCAVSGCVDYLLTSLTCAVSGCVIPDDRPGRVESVDDAVELPDSARRQRVAGVTLKLTLVVEQVRVRAVRPMSVLLVVWGLARLLCENTSRKMLTRLPPTSPARVVDGTRTRKLLGLSSVQEAVLLTR